MDSLDIARPEAPKIDLLSYRMKRDDPALSDVMSYWERLRKDGDLPSRADLDPRVISHILSRAFILDRVRPGTVRFRVAGQQLNDLMGMEVRGMPIRAFFDLMERRRLMEHVEACFTSPSRLEMDLCSEPLADTRMGSKLVGKMLILPMRDHEGQITKALGCLATNGTIGEPPRRFQLRRAQLTPIEGVEVPTPKVVESTGMAETQTLFRANNAPQKITKPDPDRLETTAVPYLKIVRH